MTRRPRDARPEIRAWLVTEIADYLEPGAHRAFLERLSPELRTLFDRRPGGRQAWAPFDLFVEALVAADEIAGRGDFASAWDIGRFTATHEAGPVRSLALKILRPGAVLSLATSLWSVHYKKAGRVAVQIVPGGGVHASIIDFPTPHPAHCAAVGGWLQGALELGPRRGVDVRKVACRCAGASTCDYRITWIEA